MYDRFYVTKVEPDADPERVIVRATAPDGRHLTMTAHRFIDNPGPPWRVGDTMLVGNNYSRP